ncbi:MAG TPA: malectin domain-containing carbohydrate-binding protein [Syntrophales bacterium]|nr:malectin domain-containing carbohydrate-binding protein [Syntrophales bacterium]
MIRKVIRLWFPLSVQVGFILAAVLCLPAGSAHAANVSLAWDANSETGLAGYKVYYGTASRNYSQTMNVGNWTTCTLSGLSEGTTYYFAVTAYDISGMESPYSVEVSYTIPAGTAGATFFAVNAGGSQYRDSQRNLYQSDRMYSGGTSYRTYSGISGTGDDPLYRCERYGNFSYSIPLANGSYQVTLKFAELDARVRRGSRVFDVLIEGKEVISDLDIYSRAGRNRALDITVPVTVSDGNLNIQFRPQRGNAQVNAILIKR